MKNVCIKCGNENERAFVEGKSEVLHGVTYVACKACGNVMLKIEGRKGLLPTPEYDSIITRLMMADAAKACGLPSNVVAINEEELVNKFNEYLDSLKEENLEDEYEDPCEDCDGYGEDCYECVYGDCEEEDEEDSDETIDVEEAICGVINGMIKAIRSSCEENEEKTTLKINKDSFNVQFNEGKLNAPIVFGPVTTPVIEPFTFAKKQQTQPNTVHSTKESSSVCYMAITTSGETIVKHVVSRESFLDYLNRNRIDVKEIYRCEKEIVNKETRYV